MKNDPHAEAGLPKPPLISRPSRWAWIISTLAALGAGLVLAFLLAIATNNPALYERHYLWLFWVNVALASTLVLVIVVAGVRLLWRVSRGRFGSRLLLKLAAIFALVGILPGVLIYTVSYQFVSRSIESWFDVKVEGALDAGLASAAARSTPSSATSRPRPGWPPSGSAKARPRPSRSRSSGCASSFRRGRSRSSAAAARPCSRPARRTRA